MKVMGIDPGKSGGWAIINEEYTIQASGHFESDLDTVFISELLGAIEFYKPSAIYCEKVNAQPKFGSKGSFIFGYSFGQIVGALWQSKVLYRLVPPQTWQREVYLGIPKDLKGKERSHLAASRLFPHDKFLISVRAKKPHEGMLEAALIAFYGIRNATGTQQSKQN